MLDEASFQIDAGEYVCLICRNGAGKSTLLKIVHGEVVTDAGEIWRQPGLSIARTWHGAVLPLQVNFTECVSEIIENAVSFSY